jgi:hypothetical protein
VRVVGAFYVCVCVCVVCVKEGFGPTATRLAQLHLQPPTQATKVLCVRVVCVHVCVLYACVRV